MPIQPIDLQVLFAHLSQVGKEQAVQKDAAVLQQSAQAKELIEKSEQQDHSINQTKEMEDGPEKIHDEKKEKQKQQQEAGGGQKEEQQEGSEDEDILKDPDLGHHIDITG